MAMGGIDFIQDLGLIMLIAAAVGIPCHRLGLPAVIGYIVAGILIGPNLLADGLIADVERIQALAQVGLVFLIFSIGQGVTLQGLRQVGLPLIFATVFIALLVLTGCRVLGTLMGWSPSFSLVLAGMLMVSSTAVLGKCLKEAGATHTRFGQTAITITALDDLVAIITLTTLTAFIDAGEADSKVVVGTMLRLKAVVATMIIGALLLVPAILNRLSRVPSEVRSLAVVGVLLGMALLSAKAGFSAALGAFLLGTIVSSTHGGERVGPIHALCEVLGPVFFVAMGMLLDMESAGASWKLSLGVFVGAVVWRTIAATASLLMIGHSLKDAIQAGLCLTPIGEFSLIIALTGVNGGLAPSALYAVAITVCVMTAVTTPILIRNSERISAAIERRQPKRLLQCITVYQDWIGLLKKRQESSLVWKLTAPRLFQASLLVLFISGMLMVAQPLHSLGQKWLGGDWPTPEGFGAVFWFSYGLLLLAPLVAVWRNIEAISMICAEAATQEKRPPLFRSFVEKSFRVICSLAVVVWWSAFFPYSALSKGAWVMILVGSVTVAVLFWRRLIRVQSRFEVELKNQLAHQASEPSQKNLPAFASNAEQAGTWELKLREFRLPASSQAAGKTLGQLPLRRLFACTVVSVDRQGLAIANPNSATVLYPNDRLFLLGRSKELREAESWLRQKLDSPGSDGSVIPQITLEKLSVPECFRHGGKSLADLSLNSLFDIQIVGIEREDERVLIPGQYESLKPGDQLLVLGTADQVNEMAFWLTT